jgi:hypothetical protein
MKPYKLIPALVLQSFLFSLAIRRKEEITNTDYNKYLHVDGNESLILQIRKLIFAKKIRCSSNQKSYLGIASKYTF